MRNLDISGEYRIAAARQAVWEALNDADVLKACIPGCQDLKKISPTDIEATILAQLGPVRSTFQAKIVLADLNPPTSYSLSGEGKSGVAGFGRGEARVVLSDVPGATLLKYSAQMKLGGKIAQIGSRLVEGATRKLADEFFAKFATTLDQAATKVQPVEAAPVAKTGVSVKWIAAAVIVAVAALTWWLTGRG